MPRLRIRLPVLYQVLAGNAVVILIGAMGGAYASLAFQMSGVALVFIFAVSGIPLSLLLNYFILRRRSTSIHILHHTIKKIDRGDSHVRADLERIDDPQLAYFAQAFNKMLARLEAHSRMTERNREQMGRLSGQVLTAQEEERKRIARELHDDTSGLLARILLNLEMCDDLLPSDCDPVRAKIHETLTLGEQTLENVRKLVFDLRPTLLDDLGLVPAIREYAKTNLEGAGIAFQLTMGEPLRASPLIETAMYRIAQEAISNVIRHARAKRVDLQLDHTDTHWRLIVQDDGCGFDPDAIMHAPVSDHGWGLMGIQERVALLNGTFTIYSKPGQGTCMRVDIPIQRV